MKYILALLLSIFCLTSHADPVWLKCMAEGSNKLVPSDLYHFTRWVRVDYKKGRLTLSAPMPKHHSAATIGVFGSGVSFSEDAIKGEGRGHIGHIGHKLYLDRNSLDLMHTETNFADPRDFGSTTKYNCEFFTDDKRTFKKWFKQHEKGQEKYLEEVGKKGTEAKEKFILNKRGKKEGNKI
jgi:hypothetical protein